ncbi:hypothetical protein UNSW2_2005 [Campylobacter concisus UNSW2]|uniref:Uncharacterized protein n=1 Tax=Campylobacter concisus UNSW2 TaxID=1242965 RepID=U2GRN7_9BACT|nr:hypothetical protein UNSW2_2005 [Campylobacter concisus UNSW2]
MVVSLIFKAFKFEGEEMVCLFLVFVCVPLILAAAPKLKPYVPELTDAAAI